MKNLLRQFCLILLLVPSAILAQKGSDLVNDLNMSNFEDVLSSYRKSTEFAKPCYPTTELAKLLASSNTGETVYYKPKKLTDQQFDQLGVRNKILYAFSFPESYYQSCTMFHVPDTVFQTIPAFLKQQGEGLRMSERQRKSLGANRDSTIQFMKDCMKEQSYLPDAFKNTILALHAVELIPSIIEKLQQEKSMKDVYAVSLLCLMMKHDYPPFQKTDVYRGLYELSEEEKDDYKAWFKRAVPFTYKNYWTVLNLARGYYVYALSDGEQFVTLPGGSYTLGEKGHQFNPEHTVEIASFKISRYEVTNWQFAEFVSATGYITLAEKNKDAMVFRLGLEEFEWVEDTTANWQFPNGFSGGSIRDKADHPVTCISYIDAKAYCEWAKVRLPTVDEWEVASKGSGDGRYFFGEDAKAIYEYANVWHGKTHLTVDPEEDFLLTAPVGSKAPNLYGIYDIYGNVFEFCEDQPATYSAYQNVAVTRGGSWWCSLYACSFFNSIDLGRVNQYASFSNNGFRVVKG